jgi:Tat protein translocase TatB subunit
MFNIGPQELLVILIVALVVVGPKRLPELGRTIGRGLNEFRKLQDEVRDMVKFDLGGDAFLNPPDTYEPDPIPGAGTEVEVDEEPDPVTHSERIVALSEDVDRADASEGADAGPDEADEEEPHMPPAAAAE